MTDDKVYDCIIIGAGPGGLQAAIYLGRYSMDVLLIDRSGGRTRHARHIENFLTRKLITGEEIIALGKEQAKSFNVAIIEKERVIDVRKNKHFEVSTLSRAYRGLFVIVSTGVYDILPPIENLAKHFGISFHTCIDCDGYRTRGKKLVILGDSVDAVNHAFAMKEMYTRDVTLIMDNVNLPPAYEEELESENIRYSRGAAAKLIGDAALEAVELRDGTRVACEAVMSVFGYRLNDEFLSGLDLKKDKKGFYFTNSHYESSLSGLYIVGPLNTGNDQVVIAAGEGATAAIDINKALLGRKKAADPPG